MKSLISILAVIFLCSWHPFNGHGNRQGEGTLREGAHGERSTPNSGGQTYTASGGGQGVPADGAIGFILIAGILLGSKKIYDSKKLKLV